MHLLHPAHPRGVIDAQARGPPLRDGEIVTACQQGCPTQAIVFGDINNPDSAVVRRKATVLNYVLLEELNTWPRTSYLSLVRNNNPWIGIEERDDGRDRPARRTAGHRAGRQPRFAEPADQQSVSCGRRRRCGGGSGSGSGSRCCWFSLIAVSWLFVNGVGVWGVNIPVAWGLAIAEYVWWIALASGGTVISALFYLTRSPWRAATNRIAETMLLAAAACAGIMPILHLGRPGLFYWLFTYPNTMGLWPQMRSPLWWDFVCLLCYILMSVMYYYVGAIPDFATVRDLAKSRRKQIFYGLLALGWRGSARHWSNHRTVYGIMAAIMAPMVISVHSVVGLDFAGGITPGWHSTQFPALFLFRGGDLRHGAGHHTDQRRARDHRAEKEIRRELRRVPAGGDPAGEIEPDDAVHRNHHRRHDRRHDAVDRPDPASAAPNRAIPAREAVKDLLAARFRQVAHRRQIRSSADIIKHDRHRDVAEQADEVPPQGAPHLRPHAHRVRIGNSQ